MIRIYNESLLQRDTTTEVIMKPQLSCLLFIMQLAAKTGSGCVRVWLAGRNANEPMIVAL